MLAARFRWLHDGVGETLGKLDLSRRLLRLMPVRSGLVAHSLVEESAETLFIERLRRGERDAIDQLYRAEHRGLRAYAQRLIGDPSAAEDLVHDVFVRLPALLANFRAESNLRTFLIGVATRLGRRYVSTAIRRRRLLAHVDAPSARDDASPERAYANAQELQRFHAALDLLPLRQRAVFVLCEVEQRSAREAAEILGVPEATVRTRCFHARKRLQQHLSRRAP